MSGLQVDVFNYLISIAYNVHYGNPFGTYGENLFMIAQNFIILFQIIAYQPKKKNEAPHSFLSFEFMWMIVLLAVFSYMIIEDLFPEVMFKYFIYIQIALGEDSTTIKHISNVLSLRWTNSINLVDPEESFNGITISNHLVHAIRWLRR